MSAEQEAPQSWPFYVNQHEWDRDIAGPKERGELPPHEMLSESICRFADGFTVQRLGYSKSKFDAYVRAFVRKAHEKGLKT